MFRPLYRRVLASTIDLLLVLGPVALVVMSQAETFTPAVAVDGSESFGPSQARITELYDGFALNVRFGTTLAFWSPWSVGLIAAIAVMLGLLIGAMIPANFGGSTPGHYLAGLRIVSTDGTEARVGQHLVRTLGLGIDLIPYVIPGLAGWLKARTSCDQQRYGDEWAATMVIDRSYRDSTAELTTPETPAADVVIIAPPTADGASGAEPASTSADTQPEWKPIDRLDPVATSTSTLVAGEKRTVAGKGQLPPPVSRRDRQRELEGTSTPTPDPKPSPRGRTERTAASAAAETTLDAELNWNPERNAWTVIEPRSGQEFVHDERTGRWIPAA